MTSQKNAKVRWSIALAILAFFLFIQVLTLIGGVDPGHYIELDDYLSTTVYKKDGSVLRFDTGELGHALPGDCIAIDVDIKQFKTEEAKSLCFFMYNSTIDVMTHGQVIYSFGHDLMQDKRPIGDVLCMVPLPAIAYEDGLQIVLHPQNGFNVGFLHKVLLMPAEEARLYPLIGQEFSYFVIVGIFAFSLLLGIILLFLKIAGIVEKSGVQLMLFTFFLTTWYLGYQHMFYCISNRILFCADVEYVAMYLTPIPLCHYLEGRKKKSKIFFGSLAHFYATLFCVATVLNYAHTGIYYSVLLPVMHVSMLVTMAGMVVCAVLNRKSEYTQERIASYGTIAFVICVILELIRIYLEKFFQIDVPQLKTLFTSGAIIICAITLFVGYGVYMVQNYRDRQEKTKYKQIAFRDFLSGIPNRNACLEGLQDFKDRGVKLYTLFFLDANYLKMVNDQYGHDMGDQLLIMSARALAGSADGASFYGRWGGDEFLVGFEDVKAAENFEDKFRAELKRINDNSPLPFEVSVAVGRVDSDLFHTLDPLEAVQVADKNMYENKRELHQNRKV
ncbi:MAG: GGDEF domain-containing protein [Lachnospiraceae bacterium]|nr:GGDEF domain-containing protein [Lachnospiraceae bacterium]